MPVNLQSFVNAANSAYFTSRDIAIQGKGENAGARLGNYIFSAGKSQNKAVMDAFKAALEKEYGVFGTHAFDTVLGSRLQMGKSLRACDVKETLSKLDSVKVTRFIGELGRQLDTNPKFRTLSPEVRQKIRTAIANEPLKNVDPKQCKSQAEIAHLAVNRLDAAIRENRTGDVAEEIGLDGRKQLESDAAGREPTGLRNLKDVFREKDTSIEDKIKKGQIGSGMRVNRSNTNPVLLDKLKTNGVEPGFIFRNDWSKDDTHGFMADIHSEASLKALEDLKAKNPQLRTACEGMTLCEQVMLAGRAHPAGMAAVAEFVLERAVDLALHPNRNHPFQDLAAALKNQFSVQDLQRLQGAVSEPRNKDLLKEAKLYLFTEIRDAVMSVGPQGNTADFYEMSPVFKHFSDRAIVKLDYNEGDKLGGEETASAGQFRRPERILATRGAIVGPIYRFTSRQSADKISAGAVTEALANDLTRIAGVPAQELEIVRGKYSDGHPKIMLSAKFAVGYRDMEDGMLKDGRAVPPPRGKSKNAPPPPQPEPLGKYKAFFLLTADRDGVGKRGQNKGFVNGKFFAIDPGHSLEGNGKYLKISDDLSFKDTYGKSLKPRFDNFSVFDDDTFFSKMEGVVNLRKLADAGEFKKLFDDYRAAFDPDEPGIDGPEKALRQMIRSDINEKETEFNEQLKKILDVSANNLALYDDLADDGPAIQKGAIETLANLEKLTSPTTWVSKRGQVALKHLEVVQDTRVPWKAALKGDDIVYFCDARMSAQTLNVLGAAVKSAGAKFETDALGRTRVTVPKDQAERFFAAFTEEKVQQLTHPVEYVARMEGRDGLKEAQTYKPAPYAKPNADLRPLLSAESLPDQLEFSVDGVVYKYPKIHYQDLLSKSSPVHRPRNLDELRNLLAAQVRRGNEVLGALMSGRESLFEPTHENVVALTHALHAAAVRKGEYMHRGSFSIEDKNGAIARWLDKVENLYIRTSTHAKPYQTARVDGHLNMPRGYDVPTGAGGLLNGMRTFHFFTIPDADGLKNGGNGNGPKRRLFLKCETFGIFCSTAHAKIFDKPASVAPGMKTRGYRFGDILESIAHGSSLFVSLFTPKEAPGIRKENLTKMQKDAILWAQNKLRTKYPQLAERLTAGNVLDGAGLNKMIDNMAWILENMPEDEDERAWITDVLDYMFAPLEKNFGNEKFGDAGNRIGNEIMIGANDLR